MVLPDDLKSADQSVLPKSAGLAIGHYGPDVAGTIRLVDGEFESDDFKGHNRPVWQECHCTYLKWVLPGRLFPFEEHAGCNLRKSSG